MKHNFKKILSLLLTVFMLMGTVSALVPFSASAESNQNDNVTVNEDGTVTIQPNKDAVYNGVTYRFDVKDGNTDSVAKINADGTVTVTFRYGDMLWFPEVKTDADASVHAEVTALGRASNTANGGTMGELFFGFGYGIKADTDNSWASGHAAVMRTIGRTRFADITPALVSAVSGSNYGHQGASDKVILNPSDELKSTSGTFTQWDYISYGSGTSERKSWEIGSTWLIDLQMDNENVIGKWSSYYGVYNTSQYETTKRANVGDDFHHQGSVGILPIWLNNSEYITVRLDSLMVDSVSVLNRKQLSGNTLWSVNGVSMRMDYSSNSHAGSGLTVNADGTLTIRGQRGDLFWMPNVEIDSTSIISTSVVMDYAINQEKASAGTVFNIQATNGAWDDNADTAMIAALRPYNGNSRRSLGAISFYSATNSADYTQVLSEVNYTPTNQNFGNTWALGAMVKTIISQNAETGEVTAVFNDSNDQLIIDAKYTNEEYPFAGPVGYMTHWSGSDSAGNSMGYYIYTIKEYKITNAIVNGVKVAEFDLIAELAKYMSEEDAYTMKSNLSLNGVIGLNVRIDDNYYITDEETVVVTDEKGKVVATEAIADLYDADNGYYAITIPVNAKEMNDVYTVSIKNGEDVLKTADVSVKEYANTLLNNSAYAEWHDLISAMLNYGAAAQKVLDYKTDALVADIGEFTYNMDALEGVSVAGNRIVSSLSASLTLESDTAVNLYFKNTDDLALTVTVGGAVVEPDVTDEGFCLVTVSGIAAEELSTDVEICISDGTNTLTVTISATRWAKNAMSDSDANMVLLAQTLAAYSAAADAMN